MMLDIAVLIFNNEEILKSICHKLLLTNTVSKKNLYFTL